jgi:quinoprotein dehydrogenase-associated probable ABC transporter substrate-binding protein
MSSVFRRGALGAIAMLALAAAALPQPSVGPPPIRPRPPVHDPGDLWVCADPNNLPFSNQRKQGFENEIAALVGRELHKRVRYFWEPQRRGFIRTTLNAGNCDLIVGVPAAYGLVTTTRPYYRSTYVFVARRDRALRLRSFDDPRLPKLLVGIQVTGEDYENPPPAHALAARRLVNNVRGFPVYGDYSKPAPQRNVIDAVADGRVDTAVVWGPLGGYFAARSAVPLEITPVDPVERPPLQFAFEISMGVRHGETVLVRQLDDVITRQQHEIDRILKRYGVPLLPIAGAS